MIGRLKLWLANQGGLLLVVLGLMIGSFGAGWTVAHWQAQAQISQLRETAARNQARIAEHASRALLEAQQRGDTLSRRLAMANRAAARLTKERSDAIAQVTTGRVCLDGNALGLLNGAPGLRVDLPAAAGRAAGASAGRIATDTDIGRWALDAGQAYDECRRRLDALIDWHDGEAP